MTTRTVRTNKPEENGQQTTTYKIKMIIQTNKPEKNEIRNYKEAKEIMKTA